MLYTEKEIQGFNQLSRLSSEEDVATLLDVYEAMMKNGVSPDTIMYPLEKDGFYIFLIGYGSGAGEFDLFPWIASHSEGMIVSCVNAKFLYGKEKSRGYYVESAVREEVPDDFDEDAVTTDQDEVATGFLDEDDDDATDGHRLYHIAKGVKLPINTRTGIVIGRSSKKTDYAVANEMVGRVHAQIYIDEKGRFMVHDCDSKNGTFIDGLRIPLGGTREIKPGNTLTLADEEFRLV